MNKRFTIVVVYAAVEAKEQDTEEFYRDLQQRMDKIPKKENIILAGDFNGRIGNQPIPECIGTSIYFSTGCLVFRNVTFFGS